MVLIPGPVLSSTKTTRVPTSATDTLALASKALMDPADQLLLEVTAYLVPSSVLRMLLLALTLMSKFSVLTVPPEFSTYFSGNLLLFFPSD